MVSRGCNRSANSACSSAVKGGMCWRGEKRISTVHKPPLDLSFSSPGGLTDRSWWTGRDQHSLLNSTSALFSVSEFAYLWIQLSICVDSQSERKVDAAVIDKNDLLFHRLSQQSSQFQLFVSPILHFQLRRNDSFIFSNVDISHTKPLGLQNKCVD